MATDGAGEGEACERCRSEGEDLGGSVIAMLPLLVPMRTSELLSLANISGTRNRKLESQIEDKPTLSSRSQPRPVR